MFSLTSTRFHFSVGDTDHRQTVMIVTIAVQNESEKRRRKERSTKNVAVNQKISTVPAVQEVNKRSTKNTSIGNEVSTRNTENDLCQDFFVNVYAVALHL